MKKFLFSVLLLLCGNNAFAEEETYQEALQPSAEEVEVTVTHKIEKKMLPLPECDDETLLAKTKEFLTTYFAETDNQSTLFRRRKYFLLNKLTDFTKEDVANYKSAATRPISDTIIELQMNEKILEENMRLCKKASARKVLGDIYLLIYPFEKGYKVHILNQGKQMLGPKNTFEY